jgi:hypothetical protein
VFCPSLRDRGGKGRSRSRSYPPAPVLCLFVTVCREDDSKWPKKNVIGKQELEIRVGNDHISFEVRPFRSLPPCSLLSSAQFSLNILSTNIDIV